MVEFKEGRDITLFVVVLRFIAVASFIAALVFGDAASKDTSGYFVEYDRMEMSMWIAGGVLSFAWWWALSIIVDACQKYLDRG